MQSLARIGRSAVLAALAVGFVAAPALAQWDTYRCAGMGTTHLGRCCPSARAETDQGPEWRAEPRHCCELDAEGTEAPASAGSSQSSPAFAPAAPGLVVAAPVAPMSTPERQVRIRTRAPPGAPLFVLHSSFLL